MARSITIGDQPFDGEAVLKHRELIIELRDEALRQQDATWSIILSMTAGLLYELAKELNNE